MALLAYKRCTNGCFFITRCKKITLLGENKLYIVLLMYFVCRSLRPVVVEPYKGIDDDFNGFPEKSININPEYLKARKVRKFLNTNYFVYLCAKVFSLKP